LRQAGLHDRNVLVADGMLTAVLDWSCSAYGDFLYDVAWLGFWSPEALGQAAWDPTHGPVPQRSGLRYRMGNPTTPG
jgi:aminoglycoside phosphotransferase (APT) family kinase protein